METHSPTKLQERWFEPSMCFLFCLQQRGDHFFRDSAGYSNPRDPIFRVLFGGNHLYVFNNPTKSGARKDITYEEAQKEIAQGAGIGISNDSGKSKGSSGPTYT